MKTRFFSLLVALILIASVPAFAATPGGQSLKNRKTLGFAGIGHLSYSSYESLYVDFATSGIITAGSGFQAFLEYGLADEFSITAALGYGRLHYAHKSSVPVLRTVIAENFVNIDVTGQYYFSGTDTTFQPYLAFGIGTTISSKGAAPLFDVGIGTHYFVSEKVSLRAQLLYKTALIHHAGELSFGAGFHF